MQKIPAVAKKPQAISPETKKSTLKPLFSRRKVFQLDASPGLVAYMQIPVRSMFNTIFYGGESK